MTVGGALLKPSGLLWLTVTSSQVPKLAPRWNEELAALHAKECERGHRNRATVEVARALVARLRAVDARGTPYEKR